MIRLKKAFDAIVWYGANMSEAIWVLWQAIRAREICGMWYDFEEQEWVFKYTADERDEMRQKSK